MARFEAQVWVSGEHPYQTEINAANVFQARKNIARREGVEEKCVNRVFEVKEETSSSSSSSSSSGSGIELDNAGAVGLVGLAVGAFVFFTFTPWILMLIGGAGGAFIAEKVTGQSIEEYNENEEGGSNTKAAIVLVLSLILGGVGFVKGTEIKKGFDAPSDTPSQVQKAN